MFKALKLTATKNDPTGTWPSEVVPELLEITNTGQLLDVGMEVYVDSNYKNNVKNRLVDTNYFETYYCFPTEEIYNNHKDLANSVVPPWKSFFGSNAELESFYTTNNLSISVTELSNPDLTGLIKLEVVKVDGNYVSDNLTSS